MKKIVLFFLSVLTAYSIFANDYLNLEKSKEISIEIPIWWTQRDLYPEEKLSLGKFDQSTQFFYNAENKISFIITKNSIWGTNWSTLWIKRYIAQLKQTEKYSQLKYEYDSNTHSVNIYGNYGRNFTDIHMFFWKYSIYSILFVMPQEKYELNKWIVNDIKSTFKFQNWYEYSLFEGVKNEIIYMFPSLLKSIIGIMIWLYLFRKFKKRNQKQQFEDNQKSS
jgi:hypothetical protein